MNGPAIRAEIAAEFLEYFPNPLVQGLVWDSSGPHSLCNVSRFAAGDSGGFGSADVGIFAG